MIAASTATGLSSLAPAWGGLIFGNILIRFEMNNYNFTK